MHNENIRNFLVLRHDLLRYLFPFSVPNSLFIFNLFYKNIQTYKFWKFLKIFNLSLNVFKTLTNQIIHFTLQFFSNLENRAFILNWRYFRQCWNEMICWSHRSVTVQPAKWCDQVAKWYVLAGELIIFIQRNDIMRTEMEPPSPQKWK